MTLDLVTDLTQNTIQAASSRSACCVSCAENARSRAACTSLTGVTSSSFSSSSSSFPSSLASDPCMYMHEIILTC